MAAPGTVSLREFLETLVRAAHRGVLRREVDAEWLGRFAEELERRARTNSLEDVSAEFVRIIAESPEAQSRWGAAIPAEAAAEYVLPALGARPAPLLCLSAGCTAASAGMLRRAGLRRWAGPFDWMTIPPGAVLDCLADDFASLLNPAHYEPIRPSDRPEGSFGHLCRHLRLAGRHGETMFHRFDPSTSHGYAALERCVTRLRESLRGLHGKMLLQVAEEEVGTEAVFAATAEVVDRVARNARLAVVALVGGEPEGPFPEMELARSLGPHRLLRARTLSEARAGGYADPLDEVVLLRGALATVTRVETAAA